RSALQLHLADGRHAHDPAAARRAPRGGHRHAARGHRARRRVPRERPRRAHHGPGGRCPRRRGHAVLASRAAAHAHRRSRVDGVMPSPNLMGGGIAKATNGSNVAIVQMGATLPTSNPPIRVAEEYAMLDCISGGRLVAGLPLGSPMDVNLAYGITPMEHRERYREAFALTLKAWQAREIFAWNGRYYQLANVNLWPRPIQQPHPPVWVPGSGSISTFEFAVDNEVCYCFLSYSGAK